MIIRPGELQLRIPSNSYFLELIRSFITQLAGKLGFDEDSIDKIELAVDEACTNVVKYAYQDNSEENSLEINVQINSNKFVITIRDFGKGFNPDGIESPEMEKYLAQFKAGGLGIFLINQLMDEVSYDIRPGVKTEVIMAKYFTQSNTKLLTKEKETV